MKVCVLASGSKGNATYIETEKTKSLIDIGMTCGYIEKKLKEINVDSKEIQNIFITHTHSDHINGLRVFLKKYNPTVYLTEEMEEELKLIIEKTCYITKEMTIEDLRVTPIKTSHDAADSNGYIFKTKNKSIMYMTDTGYINMRNFSKLKNHNMYILESNHDINMLMKSNYPYYLKQRILGDKGHLSNKECGYYLSEFTTPITSQVILAHLSEHNNEPALALSEYYKAFKKAGKEPPKVIIATQKERTEVVEIW